MTDEKKKTLKKGLGALLGEEISSIKNADSSMASIDNISPSRFQARTDISEESLEELTASIKSQGVIQPLIVRKTSVGNFELVAGERRLRASKMAGLSEVPIVVKDLSDEEIIKMGLIENLQREDLNPLDEAKGIQRLQQEFNVTQEDLGLSLGKSRTAITNSLRLLQLAKPVQTMLEEGSLSMGHARPLLTLPEAIQEKFANKIVKSGLSTRQAEKLAKSYQQEKGAKPQSPKDPNLTNLETELGDALGAKVVISHQKKGSGKITFSYKNLEQLDQIIKPLRKKE
ncbi:ParB/RepB/Spo0J family partition protein [SAR86 cluster bacterium]|nr:ParB/RepB/Spo0J family partition protein [SAR86 cluster bacterium]